MAVPKKRTSVSRKGLRRAGQHHKLYRSFSITCPNCKNPTLLHKVCPHCGHYRGRQIYTIKEKPVEEENAS
ncbi:MAG: 50S ribosomal protein L32 [Halobacteriovoraceae bacterium]|nr:50S ribosomal protein L32 [Halobacteriovoraceae bacterium]